MAGVFVPSNEGRLMVELKLPARDGDGDSKAAATQQQVGGWSNWYFDLLHCFLLLLEAIHG